MKSMRPNTDKIKQAMKKQRQVDDKKKLAVISGVSLTHLTRIVNGSTCSEAAAKKIADALNRRIDTLFEVVVRKSEGEGVKKNINTALAATKDEQKFIIENLADIRREANIRQLDLAKQVGVSPRQMARWEKGTHGVPASLVVKLAEVLGVEVSDLVGDFLAKGVERWAKWNGAESASKDTAKTPSEGTPTEAPSEAVIEAPSETPTEAPNEAPTEKATKAFTKDLDDPTEALEELEEAAATTATAATTIPSGADDTAKDAAPPKDATTPHYQDENHCLLLMKAKTVLNAVAQRRAREEFCPIINAKCKGDDCVAYDYGGRRCLIINNTF